MKLILTGCTGFVDGEVLDQCIESPSITSIIVLSRKPLSGETANHPKVTVRIMDDFTSYPDSLARDLRGAEACIWALGKASMSDLEMYRKINVEYTMAAVKAFNQHCSPHLEPRKRFRFVYCSGVAAERDENKSLLIMPGIRRIRGQIENELIAYERDHQDAMEIFILRPAMILSKRTTLHSLVFGLFSSIRVDVLAGVMLDLASNGGEGRILENGDMLGLASYRSFMIPI